MVEGVHVSARWLLRQDWEQVRRATHLQLTSHTPAADERGRSRGKQGEGEPSTLGDFVLTLLYFIQLH